MTIDKEQKYKEIVSTCISRMTQDIRSFLRYAVLNDEILKNNPDFSTNNEFYVTDCDYFANYILGEEITELNIVLVNQTSLSPKKTWKNTNKSAGTKSRLVTFSKRYFISNNEYPFTCGKFVFDYKKQNLKIDEDFFEDILNKKLRLCDGVNNSSINLEMIAYKNWEKTW